MTDELMKQIEKDAEEYAVNGVRSYQGVFRAYIAGATKYAEEVALLEEALKKIIEEGELGGSGTDSDIATDALAKLKEMRGGK